MFIGGWSCIQLLKPAMNFFSTRNSTVVVFFLLAGLAFAGCQGEKPPTDAAARSYDLIGKVIALDQKAHTITVEHGPIPGAMDAMTMEYASRDNPGMAKIAAGDKIRATLKVSNEAVWLEKIQKLP